MKRFWCAFLISLVLSVWLNNSMQGTELKNSLKSTDTLAVADINGFPSSDGVDVPKVRAIAEQITVKIFSHSRSGSGFVIEKKGEVYQVVTNRHVLNFETKSESYEVEMPDGEIYPAQVKSTVNFKNLDLSLLEFKSKNDYQLASLSPAIEEEMSKEVYAAGFPIDGDSADARGFMLTRGKIEEIIDLSFRGGYRIGYSNTVKQGMSGGPLLNSRGEVIGINGRRKFPIWGNPYVFDDGSVASPEKQQQMSKLSWGIPIQTFLDVAVELEK